MVRRPLPDATAISFIVTLSLPYIANWRRATSTISLRVLDCFLVSFIFMGSSVCG